MNRVQLKDRANLITKTSRTPRQ